MSVSIPLVAVFALGVLIAFRFTGLRLWHALMCLLCGFLIAATTAAPAINHALRAVLLWAHR